ncbi:GNAT family N-acetyltransferase [Kordiimonas marina]|uniref:GNAT family N-acetyltransferase n=1 Tax=Kordiimonas marina TaxID=2872312 RepID=UPI001FF16F10|nr:GNAT family N-acetyltransferase [Kordiimonas marina]MCJ9429238.1 GNAT family N-acetyltransferase [Kordiimonas marina]
MADGDAPHARLISSIHDIERADWDACAGAGNPFVSHAFFRCLEEAGTTTADTGWMPYHLVLHAGGDETAPPIAVMPMFLKSHSYGEYVFDHGWADAFERAGGQYYPKLQVSVPFTPVTGPRLLIRQGAQAESGPMLLAAAESATKQLQVSSCHITFMEEAEAQVAADAGWLIRTDQQFHWHNADYADFDAFLAALSSRKRKQIRKERRTAVEPGISFEHVTGDAITEAHWDAFFDFYIDTGSRKWGQPYLNREFFSRVGEAMADRILLIFAMREGQPIAGALNFIGADTLYGRYWGCVEDHPCLHFETCYYQAIDYAIAHGLKRVEAGAQGPHKLARGYEPVKTLSAHYIANPGFRDAIDRYLRQERQGVEHDIEWMAEHTPFKKG